jgi:putative endonuclease
MPTYFVYILTNNSRMLYVGVTDNLERRLIEHATKKYPGFTAKYDIAQLVYFETIPYANAAAAREKQLKGWSRAKKIVLIETINPKWEDLRGRLEYSGKRWFEDTGD